MRGFPEPLGGEAGFRAMYAGGDYATAPLVGDLGDVFLGDRVSFKPWPCCRGTHGFIQAGLAIRSAHSPDPVAIARIEVSIAPIHRMLVEPAATKTAPHTAIDAKFSIPFTLAAALVEGRVGLDSFAPATREDPRITALAGRVVPTPNSKWGVNRRRQTSWR